MANFGGYNKTYGSMAAVIIFLVWMWISTSPSCSAWNSTPNSNAPGPSTAATLPEEPYVEPRDTRKL